MKTAAVHSRSKTFRVGAEKRNTFSLIGLLVITSQHCRHFIHNSCFASAKTYSLFLKRREGCGERGIIEADGRPFPGKRSFSSLPAAHFTLIELLVVNSQLCRDFFKRFVCTDQYGCVRKHTENAAHKNTPHHTCKASASCLPQANASCSNFAPGRIY